MRMLCWQHAKINTLKLILNNKIQKHLLPFVFTDQVLFLRLKVQALQTVNYKFSALYSLNVSHSIYIHKNTKLYLKKNSIFGESMILLVQFLSPKIKI